MITVNDPVYFLLVDDLEENLLSLEALLRRDGLVLLKAKSGPEALELLLKYDIALALVDVQMPAMDGFELAELMRSTERTRRMPIIFLTAGNADHQRRFRGYEAGAVDFLYKPIETDVLRNKVKVFFELYRQQQQLAAQRDELKASAEENAFLLQESLRYADKLKEIDDRKNEFLATLAHELRNPLTPIRNGLQILRMSPKTDVATKVRDMMDRQLTHMVRLIDDLLDVSRISEGKIDLRKERITFQAILQAAIEASKPLIEAAHHTLQIDIPDEPFWLDADLTRLAQIMSNLLNNAAKYTPEGGKISVTAKLRGEAIVVTVVDNGMGIPGNMISQIFELFAQADNAPDGLRGGLGIGLALAKRFVEMHGGTITAQSPGLGKGSTFTLRLPLASTGAVKSESEKQLVGKSLTSEQSFRVLVVDDNVASAQTTGWMLELMGHKPTLVHNGLEAVAAAEKLNADVIILDIGLPGMSGYEVCRILRKNSMFKNTLLIAQTGWGQERDRQESQEAGFNYHLTKPVKFEEFESLLLNPHKKSLTG